MGLGLLGRGLGDTKFLAELGAELIVTDLKSEAELAPSLAKLKDFPNITYRLGKHELADFQNRDFILKGPNVPNDSSYLAEARKQGIPIKMSASWFAELADIPVVGVTGTRGKSTTTELIRQIMEAGGLNVLLGGNVRGVSTLALLPEVKADSIALMELDSWQCRGFGDAGLSPEVAVFTTFYPDHLDYYRGDMEAYLADKAEIFLHQKPEDTLVVSTEALPILKEKYGTKVRSRLVVADPTKFPNGWRMDLPGEHNRLNAMCAWKAAEALGIDEDVIRKTITRFRGVPGRLEFVREIEGVKIYNDTTATTPEATLAALRALDPECQKSIVLIMGGADKSLDMSGLLAEIPAHTRKVLLLMGSGTERIQNSMPEATVYESLESAVKSAADSAQRGDIILFSPAFASFGMFKNEFDRGDRFVALVKSL